MKINIKRENSPEDVCLVERVVLEKGWEAAVAVAAAAAVVAAAAAAAMEALEGSGAGAAGAASRATRSDRRTAAPVCAGCPQF